jgi:hypothetical protein
MVEIAQVAAKVFQVEPQLHGLCVVKAHRIIVLEPLAAATL